MPVSTRHSAATAAPATSQSKLNFGARKPTAGAHIKALKPVTDSPALAQPKKEEESVVEVLASDDDAQEEEEQQQAGELDAKAELDEAIEPATDVEEEEAEDEDEAEGARFQEQIVDRPKLDTSGVSKDCTDEAYDISNEQITRYYKGIQNARIAAPVHQEGLTEYERILRHFDLSSQYGPCVATTRLQRWARAHRFGLEPPVEVLAVLLKADLAGDVPPPPSNEWKPAPTAARDGVGAAAYLNSLLATATHAE